MEYKDILLSTSSVEEPMLHTVLINGNLLNIALVLRKLILIGPSVNSANSEYRGITLNTTPINKLLKGELKKEFPIYYDLHSKLMKQMKANAITFKGQELKNISGHGLCYSLIYYMVLGYQRYSEEQLVDFNSFSSIVDIIHIMENAIGSITKNANALKHFAHCMMTFEDSPQYIGSKLLLLTREQIDNTNDLSHSIWKSMYINRILRNISIRIRKRFLAPALDWTLIHAPSKQIFTNETLLNKIRYGSGIQFIRSNAIKQYALAGDLVANQIHNHEIEQIKAITSRLKDVTIDMDYALADLSIAVFYSNMGESLFGTINKFVEDRKNNKSTSADIDLISDPEVFRQLIFQFCYSITLLAQHGIMHNDPHLNNVLITNRSSSKLEVFLPTNKFMSAGECNFDLTLIDFDKSILSHHHHNFFDRISTKINEEMGIVFDTVKETIVNNYNQVFNCYLMYDVVRFCLVLSRIIQEAAITLADSKAPIDITKQQDILNTIIKLASDTMHKLYDPQATFEFDIENTHGSITWLMEKAFKDYIKVNKTKSSINSEAQLSKMKSSISNNHPEFVSSRRKYAEKLKYNYISEYVSKDKIDIDF